MIGIQELCILFQVSTLTRPFDHSILSAPVISVALDASHMIDNSLTSASFDSLLAQLGPDRESAARAYLDLRRALFIFFATRGAASPDEMTDETINRVTRRIHEGQDVYNLTGYICGVAKLVHALRRWHGQLQVHLGHGR